MDRFLDDTNIKKKGNTRIQNSIATARALQKQVKDQLDSLTEEERNSLINNNFNVNAVKNDIIEKLDLPIQQAKLTKKVNKSVSNEPSNDISTNDEPIRNMPVQDISIQDVPINNEFLQNNSVNESVENDKISFTSTTNNIQQINSEELNLNDINKMITQQVREVNHQNIEETYQDDIIPLDSPYISNEIIKSADEQKSQQELYNQEMNRLYNECSELIPEEKSSLDIQLQSPKFIVSRNKGKVTVETQKFKEMQKEKMINERFNTNLLFEKQKESSKILDSAKIELEIYTRMKNLLPSVLQPMCESNIKNQKNKIKEYELRLAILANLIAGR